ncbi:MAG: hypothetical protein H6738_03010 [Alphaproteobacteria bacterium]|nr:hypothetical protein [Alphaproteobacteria bacterium]MCB9695739.1 hypothetical protein [Alphaproteobacteria bacterium]
MPEDFASQIATLRVSLAAEERQWEIGTWSSGSGEGLASMFEVRTLQVARAWLTPDREEGRALMQQVSDDPNDSGARLRPHIDAWLASPDVRFG